MSKYLGDFRSDTVTLPSKAMRQRMMEAEVGDDVYGDDPSVSALEAYASERFGCEATAFCSSGTQANLLAIMSHCQRGDEYICGQMAHNYRFEAGGAAVLGSIQPQPLANKSDGSIDLNLIESAIKPDDFHFARTRLVSLENTIGGKVLPWGYSEQVRALADTHQLALHLDGARVFNAIVAQQVDEKAMLAPFDSFTICLSKGLGAPVGSLLCGSRDYIREARRWRKMLGGGMRQAGILAAAGHYALEHNIQRLSDDHENAQRLAQGLANIDELHCDASAVQTNIVYASCSLGLQHSLAQHLKQRGYLISAGEPIRFVTHLDISAQAIEGLLNEIKAFYQQVKAA